MASFYSAEKCDSWCISSPLKSSPCRKNILQLITTCECFGQGNFLHAWKHDYSDPIEKRLDLSNMIFNENGVNRNGSENNAGACQFSDEQGFVSEIWMIHGFAICIQISIMPKVTAHVEMEVTPNSQFSSRLQSRKRSKNHSNLK